ncbi:hypothetical protein HAX54_005938 [Datura stramonium]|uniref:Uncharacterized protein n=1 Tax=Datura stramonium TaxID=4076 RepID=A0ABS8TAV4_DATST|nr:hypothetical protein [Datura stramonium]
MGMIGTLCWYPGMWPSWDDKTFIWGKAKSSRARRANWTTQGCGLYREHDNKTLVVVKKVFGNRPNVLRDWLKAVEEIRWNGVASVGSIEDDSHGFRWNSFVFERKKCWNSSKENEDCGEGWRT